MKRFTVHWQEKAEAELALLWQSTDDRSALAEAADAIDRILAESADQVGESRDKSERIYFHQKPAVHYRVWPQDRRVMVQKVWTVDR